MKFKCDGKNCGEELETIQENVKDGSLYACTSADCHKRGYVIYIPWKLVEQL